MGKPCGARGSQIELFSSLKETPTQTGIRANSPNARPRGVGREAGVNLAKLIMKSFVEARLKMVEKQIASRGVRNAEVLEAMREVPRECFVPERLREFAYDDSPLPIEEGQTISQPYIVAVMVEALHLDPRDRVLEIGAGSGYAASVISRIVREVYTVERHPVLAELARQRAGELGYKNLKVRTGDGTLGWPEEAPFDAIVVAAGGPEVPQSLLEQLAIGGRLVIPVGDDTKYQELRCIERTGEHAYDRRSLGRVQFVPLIGSEGWALDGKPMPEHRASPPLRMVPEKRQRISRLIAENCEPFDSIDGADLDPLLKRFGDARVVLIGEASHGTSEFYRMRARITRELIEKRGFNIVAIEGDYPDASVLDRAIRGRTRRKLRNDPFSRFPTWMWHNQEMEEFIAWAAGHNAPIRTPERQLGLCGLDLYSLYNSIGEVLDYLERVDPEAAESARVRYGCFSPWETDPATYGRAAVSGRLKDCEDEVVKTLFYLLEKRVRYAAVDSDEMFDAERNATVVREAERYYRVMYYGNNESWNLRDRHMFDTLKAVMDHRGAGARAVVWAHNSHVGDASATEMGMRGELNLGQLAHEHWGQFSYHIGFGTDRGTVAAASNWDEPIQFKNVRPSHVDSYERLCHETEIPSFFLPLRNPLDADLRRELLEPHLERAIGVIYRPETELVSHYFQAALPAQFDEFIWFDETTAVTPITTSKSPGVPGTYPFGL